MMLYFHPGDLIGNIESPFVEIIFIVFFILFFVVPIVAVISGITVIVISTVKRKPIIEKIALNSDDEKI